MNTTWKFYVTAEQAWDGMYAACERSRVSIDFEQYLLSDDLIGRKFIELFIRKALEGVRVRVLCDAVGSRTFYTSPVVLEMQKAGVEVVFFNPITPLWVHRFTSWFLRDHRKILVVDGERGFTGGVGIESPMNGWRDTHVEITGPIVYLMERAFNQMWEMTQRGERFIKFPWPEAATKDFNFLTNSPYLHQRFIYHLLIAAIRGARRYIYLTTPYFVPDRKLFKAIKQARRRGVDVRLIVPEHSDHPLVDLASQSYFKALLKVGVKVFLYKDRVLHAKTVVIDDSWASIGSANLDNLSLLLNYENTVVGIDLGFVAALKAHFEEDCLNSTSLTNSGWKERSWIQKFLQLLTMPFHRLM